MGTRKLIEGGFGGTFHLTAQAPGVPGGVEVASPQPAQLAPAQPRPGHEYDDEAVTGRSARVEQGHDVVVAGSVDRSFGLMKAVTGSQPPWDPAVFAAGRLGQVAVVGQLIDERNQPRRGLAGRDGVGDEPTHRAEHDVDPPGAANRPAPGPGQHLAKLAVRLRPGVGQPGHEQPEVLDAGMPVPAGVPAPAKEQGDRAGIGLGRQLRAVTAEAKMSKVGVGLVDHDQLVVNHGPVACPRRKPHH